ncbi:hypothetical protein BT69DRAFT_1283186, partial [Atractiella rhizophila]
KHETLFSRFGIDYNDEPDVPVFQKGNLLVWEEVEEAATPIATRREEKEERWKDHRLKGKTSSELQLYMRMCTT